MVNMVGSMILGTINCIVGVIAYAKYYECDLLASKKVEKSEQVLTFF